MSIDNVGDSSPSFIPPEEDEENKKNHGDLSGHDLSLKKSSFSKSLPDLSKLNKEQLLLRKSYSDTDLETKEHIYDVPRNVEKEPIYDVPRDFSPKESIYDTVKPSILKKEELEDVETKVKEVSSFLSSSKLDEEKLSHYDYVRKPGESSSSVQEAIYEPMLGQSIYDYVRKPGESSASIQEAIYEPMMSLEEPVYESIEDLFFDLGSLESLENIQRAKIRELSESVESSLDECISKCEEILSKSKNQQVKDQSNLEGEENFSKLTSHLQSIIGVFLLKLSSWGKNFSTGFKEALFKMRIPKGKTPTDIYYKQTTSPLMADVFQFASQSMSEEAKKQLKVLAERLGLQLEFEESAEGEVIVMKASTSFSFLSKLKEKFEKLLSLLSLSQNLSKEEISNLLESFLNFLESSSEKLQNLINEQKKSLKAIFSKKNLKRSYSFDSRVEPGLTETYKKRKDDSTGEEDDKL